jgi:hypothetical protein
MDALPVNGPENAVRACDLDGAKRFDYLSGTDAYSEDNDEYRQVAALNRLLNAEQRSCRCNNVAAAARGASREIIEPPAMPTAQMSGGPWYPRFECVSGFPPDRVRPRPVCFRRRPYSRPAPSSPGPAASSGRQRGWWIREYCRASCDDQNAVMPVRTTRW